MSYQPVFQPIARLIVDQISYQLTDTSPGLKGAKPPCLHLDDSGFILCILNFSLKTKRNDTRYD